MVPRERLGTETVEILRAQGIRRPPAPKLKVAIAPFQSSRSNCFSPGGIGAIESFKPGVHTGTGTPRGFNHRSQPAITTADEVLHGRQADIGEVETHTPQATAGVPQQPLTSLKFIRRHAVPLERRVGLWGEVADGDIQAQATKIATALLEHHAGVDDAQHIGIRFTGKTDHEVQLHLAVAVLHRRADAIEKVVVRQSFVDDVA